MYIFLIYCLLYRHKSIAAQWPGRLSALWHQKRNSCHECYCHGALGVFGSTVVVLHRGCQATTVTILWTQKGCLLCELDCRHVCIRCLLSLLNMKMFIGPVAWPCNAISRHQQLSHSESKRKRRDIDDFCEAAGAVKPMSYFCVHRLTGGI